MGDNFHKPGACPQEGFGILTDALAGTVIDRRTFGLRALSIQQLHRECMV